MSNVRLPVIQPEGDVRLEPEEHVPGSGSLGKDGKRRRPYPADVHGPWTRARRVVYGLLIGLWTALPWIPIHGHPAVFIDVERRRFFLFGATFNAQDTWLLFFLVSGFGFGLLYLTALLGRVWCGWACPQTVFVEAVFRPIERLVNGPRNTALRRARRPMDIERVWRTAATHALYVVASILVAHVVLAYFASLPAVFAMVRAKPSAHPEAFAWTLGVTALVYVAFGLFREQFCVVMCPYGRLQSVLLDDDAMVIGYDERRGEPRGKALAKASLAKASRAVGGVGEIESERGDCVDCDRCVVVCPTGIDIREGLQLDCIACTACIDACDAVMVKLGRPKGLVRYDSLRGLRGEPKRILRPRIALYSLLGVIGIVVASFAFRSRAPFEANLLRLPGPPYTREEVDADGNTNPRTGSVRRLRNGFEIHLVNKTAEPATFTITPAPAALETDGMTVVLPLEHVTIEPLGSQRVPLFVTMDEARFSGSRPFVIKVEGATTSRDLRATFLGASSPQGTRP